MSSACTSDNGCQSTGHTVNFVTPYPCDKLTVLGPDLQNILRQSYDYLTIMQKLRSTYDGHLIYKTSYNEWKVFIGKIHVQNRNIVGDSVRKLAYNIPERNFSTF